MWLRLWLQIGMIVVALVLTGQWNRSIHFVRRQWARPKFPDRTIDLASSPREPKGKTRSDSAILIAHSPSHATSTGISVEEGQATILRRRTKTVASEAIKMPTSGLADEHLRARNRAVHPAGKERVEKERRRRDREETKWTKAVDFRSARLNEVNPSVIYYPQTRWQEEVWDRLHDTVVSVSDFPTPEYFDTEFGYFWEESRESGIETFKDFEVVEEYEFEFEWLHSAWRRAKSSKAEATKQAQRLNRGITLSPWPIPRRKKRNPRKGKRGFLYSDPLDESEALDRFEDRVPY